jgi:glycosyltransferase involved in cell wall biosynthesis
MKIAIVTCYDQQDYVRGRVLKAALAKLPDVELIIIRNDNKGLARYIEVPFKILKARFRDKPDVYLINFRGYEMMLYMTYTLVRKPIIFDEMINFTEWMDEHAVIKPGTFRYKLFRWWYASWAKRARVILADTDAHAHYSAQLNKFKLSTYYSIPVGTDETVFYPRTVEKPKGGDFTVFYYGHMLPLHGLKYVLEAADLLRTHENITFRFVGGKQSTVDMIEAAIAGGANITHEKWVPFEELPQAALEAGLTLGGPFGNTTQSQYVITGKTYQFMSAGAPVLIGNNKVSEGFTDKLNCLLVPQADPQAIATAVVWASEHPKELKKIASEGHKLYQKHFSQKVVDGLVAELVAKL